MFEKFIFVANIYCFGAQRKTFCYKINEEQKDLIGSLVEVGFGKKILTGVVLSIKQVEIVNGRIIIDNDSFSAEKIKEINNVVYKNLISEVFLQFLIKMAWYNVIDLERLLENVIPSCWLNKKRELKTIDELNKKEKKNIGFNLIQLNEEQDNIAKSIKIDSFVVSLIRGSMGSGKTYIFLEIVRKKIFENKENQVLIMVPEIALTNNLIDIVYSFTGIKPIIWHSSVSLAKKKIYYENIINGKIKIVISTRSGLLLPYKKLSLIVIDEEHDQSYKQEEIPCYHSRDMAILRAKYENIPVVLSSATPSIETIANVLNKKYEIFQIKKQFFNSNPPKVELINSFNGK